MNEAETPRWMQDKHFNEVLFCEDFLVAHPMVCVSGSFFTVDGRVTDEVIRAYTTQKYVHHGRMNQEI